MLKKVLTYLKIYFEWFQKGIKVGSKKNIYIYLDGRGFF